MGDLSKKSCDLPASDLLDAAFFRSGLSPLKKEELRLLLQIPLVQDKVRHIFLKFYESRQ